MYQQFTTKTRRRLVKTRNPHLSVRTSISLFWLGSFSLFRFGVVKFYGFLVSVKLYAK